MKPFIEIREVGPREGAQVHHSVIETASKLRLIELLGASGLRKIEVTSFVRPDKVPQMADADAIAAGVAVLPAAVRRTALALNERGFRRAMDHPSLSMRCWLSTALSESFLQSNTGRTIDSGVAEIPHWCDLFAEYGRTTEGLLVSTVWGYRQPDEVSVDALVRLIARYCEGLARCGHGLSELSLADTVGLAAPGGVRRVIRAVRAEFPKLTLSLHLHDTRGLGIANAVAGLDEGVTIFDASIGGVGGCPFAVGAAGNIATEDLVYLIHREGGETGVSLDRLLDAARYAESLFGSPLPGRLSRAKNHW